MTSLSVPPETPDCALSMDDVFRDVVARRAFSYVAQPIVRLCDGATVRHEVLVRFQSGESPAALIEAAERSGSISALDLAVTEAAIDYLERGGTASLSVNVSAVTLDDGAAISSFAMMLARALINRRQLSFEITESAAIADLPAANQAIQRLRRAGHAVWLDDFGAGFSSLSYLQALDVDGVKIDGRYMRSALASARDERLFRSIARFCSEMGVETVAEMIEEREHCDLATELGVGCGQGWWFARPAPLPELFNAPSQQTEAVG
ncbi:MAG: EAL domain-containing protein [Caulobacterales bacterium]